MPVDLYETKAVYVMMNFILLVFEYLNKSLAIQRKRSELSQR
jgi:hypothetical protein